MNNPLGIYIHIPFCSGKCGYCDFYSAPAEAETMNRYTEALIRHIRESARMDADTVYFGGGTPSIIGVKNLVHILNAVRESFNLALDAQITLEANPGDIRLTPENTDYDPIYALSILRAAGFNRISFGVQSSCDETLKMLGRRHDYREAEYAVFAAGRAGFDDISLDLMYGLPNQTMENWRQSVVDICALSPGHISCYALKLSNSVPMKHLEPEIPDDDTQLEMYLEAVRIFEENGYHQYEISNFAGEGKLSRHNIKYWTGGDYLGFGPSAHSLISGVRFAYADDTSAYIRGERVYKEQITLTHRDRLEEYIMLGLRTSDGINLNRIPQEIRPSFKNILTKYIPHGLVSGGENRYSLTPRGMFVSNYIISELFGNIPNEMD